MCVRMLGEALRVSGWYRCWKIVVLLIGSDSSNIIVLVWAFRRSSKTEGKNTKSLLQGAIKDRGTRTRVGISWDISWCCVTFQSLGDRKLMEARTSSSRMEKSPNRPTDPCQHQNPLFEFRVGWTSYVWDLDFSDSSDFSEYHPRATTRGCNLQQHHLGRGLRYVAKPLFCHKPQSTDMLSHADGHRPASKWRGWESPTSFLPWV
jgi:hypothetical protein